MITSNKLSTNELKYLASICLNLELFEDAYEYVQLLVQQKQGDLDEEERNLYMRSVKGKLNIYRNGWKALIGYENYEGEKIALPKELIEDKKRYLETTIKDFCLNTVKTIENVLQDKIKENDFSAEIFYLKLKADHYRYYGEIASEDDFRQYKDICKNCYEQAYELCKEKLECISPLYLSVTLNYSVFLYTLTEEVKLAFDKANYVYKQAILKLSPEQKIPEVENIIKSIEENLTIWKIELADFNN